MKKIVFLSKFILAVVFFALLFVILFMNNKEMVTFHYVLGESQWALSYLIFLVFTLGGLFGILVSFLLGITTFWKGIKQKSEIKRLEKQVDALNKAKAMN